jgi:hypothetical protein
MSPEQTRRERAVVVVTYRRMVEELNQQAAALHGQDLGPVVRFLESQQSLAEQALRELDADHAAGMEDGPEPTPEQRQRWAAADVEWDARYGDLLPPDGRTFPDVDYFTEGDIRHENGEF